MNRPELFEKSVNTLLDAYNNRILEHGRCYACAVGNLCSEAAQNLNVSNTIWNNVFMTGSNAHKQIFYIKEKLEDERQIEYEKALKLISKTGYTVEELAAIEYAFESSIADDYERYTTRDKVKGQYIGLCAVLEVLKEIHEKEEIAEEQKQLDSIYESKLALV